MSTEKRVFSRMFDGDKHAARLRAEKRKADNLKKVALGLVDEISYEYSYLEDQASLLSYIAYEWHDQKFEEYRQAWVALNDEYTYNASTVLRYDDVSGDRETLNEIAEKAAELGLEPYEVYDQFDEHMQLLDDMEQADDQYSKNEDEFMNWG